MTLWRKRRNTKKGAKEGREISVHRGEVEKFIEGREMAAGPTWAVDRSNHNVLLALMKESGMGAPFAPDLAVGRFQASGE